MQRKEIEKLKARKKIWKIFDWGFPGSGLGFFRKNHSLNCGCQQCKTNTELRRMENKKERARRKQELKKEIKEI